MKTQIRSGLLWSFVNTLVARLGSFLAGIVIARIVAPEDFGVYAVALVALNLLLSANELGVSVALVRHEGPIERIAPTVATLSIVSSAALFALSLIAAGPFAAAMGVPEAAGVVQLMSVAVLIDGATSVPVALLTRAFMQARRMQIDAAAFVISTPITIVLAIAGYGAWSLAWGAVIGNLVTGILSILFAPQKVWPGFNRQAAGEVLRFGLPLAGASLLLLALVNVDFIVVGRLLGTEQLGFYLLAFNLSAWPMMLVSSVVRRVTTPAFARLHQSGDGPAGYRSAQYLVLGLAGLMCVLLAVYATELVTFLYGDRWEPSAVAVPALVVLSLGRLIVELAYDYLAAVGKSVGNAWLHAIWLIVLIPVLIVGAQWLGIQGVALAHALVVIVVVLPGAALLLHREDVRIWPLVRDLALPAVGCVAVALSGLLVKQWLPEGFWLLATGGLIGLAVYALAVAPRFTRVVRELMLADVTPGSGRDPAE
nr:MULTISPECIES: oligosaccharide flippase family protein [unclassified Cryobacterium]